jgi:hypothetical protein
MSDYMKTYREFWAPLVETNGVLDLDRVARELSDYRVVMEELSRAYDELTGGALSKPNTAAAHVIDFTERRFAREYAELLCSRAQEDYDNGEGEIGDAMRELAEEWCSGAWTEYEMHRAAIESKLAGQ